MIDLKPGAKNAETEALDEIAAQALSELANVAGNLQAVAQQMGDGAALALSQLAGVTGSLQDIAAQMGEGAAKALDDAETVADSKVSEALDDVETVAESKVSEALDDVETAADTGAETTASDDPIVEAVLDSKSASDAGIDDSIESATASEQKNSEASDMLFDNLNAGFSDLTTKIATDFDDVGGSVKETFKGVGKNIMDDLGGMLGGSLTDMFTKMFGGTDGGLGAGLGGLFSTGLGGLLGFAGGGRISADAPVLVGERGPELIIPDRSRSVINAADTRVDGMGGALQITQNVKFDLVPEPTVDAMIRKQLPAVKQAAVEASLAAIRNRGY